MSKTQQLVRDETASVLQAHTTGGFDFGSCKRNEFIVKKGKGIKLPKFTKTGTTICGLIYKDGVVLGADTRSTAGPIVANKNCEKLHYMAPNIYCAGAGTAADCDQETKLIESQLNLLRLNTGRQTRVCVALTRLKRHLFRYQGYIGAYLVVGGCDSTGPHLHTVYAHGSTDTLPYVTMGSGSLAAMAMFESRFKSGMSEEEAKTLVAAAIQSGIDNDLGSGSNVDLVVIRKDGTKDFLRNYKKTVIPEQQNAEYLFKPGTTPYKSIKTTAHPAPPADEEADEKADGMDVES